ncbi:hypothetical protein BGI33_03620 [Snodgrassella alvi]|nr:hypothetical protein BGI33_03620 [Snodgrassella alvi]PIT16984.1 hypothetical protein BGI34_08080 [Snodgrassella alvi]
MLIAFHSINFEKPTYILTSIRKNRLTGSMNRRQKTFCHGSLYKAYPWHGNQTIKPRNKILAVLSVILKQPVKTGRAIERSKDILRFNYGCVNKLIMLPY